MHEFGKKNHINNIFHLLSTKIIGQRIVPTLIHWIIVIRQEVVYIELIICIVCLKMI